MKKKMETNVVKVYIQIKLIFRIQSATYLLIER
jgi:hypothetical protein